jgi:hypothetical protein
MDLKVIIKAQKISFAKFQGQNNADYIFDKQGVIQKDVCLKGRESLYVEVIGR